LQVWGLFAAIGVVLASWFALRQAKKRGLDVAKFETLVFQTVIWSFIGARLGHVLLYEPARYLADPFEIIAVWHGGFSSFGGFIGATITFFWSARKKTLPILPTADVLMLALPLGLGCGRIGCFLIHDHPGTLSHSFLAVKYPGGPRFDLGLLLGLFDFIFFAATLRLLRKKRPDGFYFALFPLVYGPIRFGLDFLRVADARYFGLTPAQYGSLALFIFGSYLFKRIVLKNA
jgi:phosphatidylglycerol:prolipoprotein diacylglycerol transferase